MVKYLTIFLLLSSAAYAQGIDCERDNLSYVEKTVCSDKSLNSYDYEAQEIPIKSKYLQNQFLKFANQTDNASKPPASEPKKKHLLVYYYKSQNQAARIIGV